MRFERATRLSATPEEVWSWHSRVGALERLSPPWQSIESLGEVGTPQIGSRVHLRLGRGLLAIRWTAEHTAVEPGRGFEDVQVEGPFKSWRHQHAFLPVGENSSLLRDRIDYEIPGGRLLGRMAARPIERSIERTFAYRHRVTSEDLELHKGFAAARPLRVGVTGASGLVGRVLVPMLTTGGHEVVHLVRAESTPRRLDQARWSPELGVLDPSRLEGLDAVVHLAGENISQRRWTIQQRERIRWSRVVGTARLVESLGDLERPPKAFVSASAVGYYGDRGDELLDEESDPGSGFLAAVCQDLEAAAAEARHWAERVVMARLGVVLSARGGALASMLPAFRAGVGGVMGSGRQFVSWISIDDAAGALIHILQSDNLQGPVNLVAPRPQRNRDFVRQLAATLRRPAVVPMPSWVARGLFGPIASEILLSGASVQPERLQTSDYRFRHAELEPAIRFLLGRQ